MKRFVEFLRFALAGLVLVVLAIISTAWLTGQNQPVKSVMDGRSLTMFEAPSQSTFLDGSWMHNVESFVDDRMPARRALLNLHAAFATKVFRNNFVSGVWIDRETGMLSEEMPQLAPVERLDPGFASISTIATANNVPLLFVYVPKKQEVFADQLPPHWNNVYLDNKPAAISQFNKYGPVLDLTDVIGNKKNRLDYWFLTDHHWKAAGAIAASNAVRNKLISLGIVAPQAMPTLDKTYRFPEFVGSIGRKITYVGVPQKDELVVPWVKHSGLTHCADRALDTVKCSDPIISMRRGNEKNIYANRYGAFMGGDNGIDDIRGNGTGTYIILKDSFGDAFVPYFALGAKRVVSIDERHYSGESLSQLVRELKPDGVIVMHNQLTLSTFGETEMNVWR